MTVTKTYPRAGQMEPGWEEYTETLPANTGDGGMTAGLILCIVTGKAVKAPIDATGVKPFYGLIENKLDTDNFVRVISYGLFYGYAEGAIAVGSQLTTGTVTAGHLKIAGAAVFNKIVGDYYGHPAEGSGNSPFTAAANGEIIVVFIR